MINTIYIEQEIVDHPRTLEICARFPDATLISCSHYGEIFNRKAQNFRLQKENPAMILAKKNNHFLHQAPPEYGIGGEYHYYFSHMLNCIYDCRYCFLQGMYRSANYVIFVNYEDFQAAMQEKSREHGDKTVNFYSGYDCDSLALDPVTRFTAEFLPLFKTLPNSWLELRTKSTQIRGLLKMEPAPNCVVAFSFIPAEPGRDLEQGVPQLERRLEAMLKLCNRGWKLGLRFDPLIYQPGFEKLYQALFETIFSQLPLAAIHSVSLGAFRMPDKFFRNIVRLYPDEKFYAGPFSSQHGMTSYQRDLEQDMMSACATQILEYIPKSKFFPCDDAYR